MIDSFGDFDPEDFAVQRVQRTNKKQKDERSWSSVAGECEKLVTDEQRREYFGKIKLNANDSLDLYCSGLLVLARDVADPELRDELRSFFVEHLSDERSKFVRKTCAYVLKTYFYNQDHWVLNEFFVLISTLEETQFHLIDPVLSKLTTLAVEIERQKSDCPLSWSLLRSAFVLAYRHVNGWVRVNVLLQTIRLPYSLIENDYEFVVDIFYRSLNPYDIYWRLNEICDGISNFLNELRGFLEHFQTREFYIRLLSIHTQKWAPTSLFFTSCALPQNTAKLLDEEDLPLIRRVFVECDYCQYLKLKLNVSFNFFSFLQRVCNFKNESTWKKLKSLLPEEVRQHIGDQKIEIDESTEKPQEENDQLQKWINRPVDEIDVKSELSELLDVVTTNQMAMSLIEKLVQIIPRANAKEQLQILETMIVCFGDLKKSKFSASLCGFCCNAIIASQKVDFEVRVNHLQNLLSCAERNQQFGFAISRAFFIASALPIGFASVVLDLCVYGNIPQKVDEVLMIAHALASSDFGLDEITDFDRINRRTREMAIITLLKICLADKSAFRNTIDRIIETCRELDKFGNRSFGLSNGHRMKTRYINLLLLFVGQNVLIESLTQQLTSKIVAACVETLMDGNQQFSIRLPAEWILSLFCKRSNEFFDDWIERAPTMAAERIGSVASWVAILTRALKDESSDERIRTSMIKILPWTSVQNFPVRAMALASIRILVSWHSKLTNSDPMLAFAFALANFEVDVAGNSQKIVKTLTAEPYFTQITTSDTDLHSIFYVLAKLCGMPDDELIFEEQPSLDDQLKDLRIVKSINSAINISDSWIFSGISNSSLTRPEVRTAENTNDKIGILAELEVQQKLNTIELEIQANDRREQNSENQLIVVASLVNKAANLGGLCRTCEVFNTTELVISDAAVIKEHDFRSLSMSAELHLPVVEVKPASLIEYLKECRLRGFTIVAAEQTSQSIPLDKFTFPPRSLVLLGEERKGVPVELLRYVDQTVEITQLGQTRSLNVHVSGSLFVYQWAAQNLLSNQ
ncbi:SpoU-methylase domain-containing protein [Aphelenchoides besseyi]|nr:SpoU-methylase domain-containing protein [Aphelenchoides besseyi]